MLRRQWQALAVPLAEQGIPAMVIKGPDFADRLYSHAGLRPFRDIDLLTPRDARPAVESAMARIGYRRAPQPPLKHAQEYGEETWHLADRGGSGGVEVHWNLVNSPAIRAGISVECDLIVGLPGDTANDVRDSLDFVLSLDPGRVQLSTLHVLPGTDLWHRAQELGLVYDPQPPHELIQTAQLSYAELRQLEVSGNAATALYRARIDRKSVV